MIVITQDTEKLFKQELEICSQRSDLWRCLIINFSKLNRKPDNWFSTVLDKISSCLGEDGTRAFLFENQDVYFLLKYATQKAYLSAVNQLSELMNIDIRNLCALYEIRVDKEVLDNILKERMSLTPSNLQQSAPPSLLQNITLMSLYHPSLTGKFKNNEAQY